jgi:Flp pilus assembly protein TadB
VLIFAVILLVLGVVLLGLGVTLFANGVRVRAQPRSVEPGAPDGTKEELEQLPWKELFSRMKTSVKVFTSGEAGQDDRLKAAGALCVLTGIVVVCLAVLAFIAAIV